MSREIKFRVWLPNMLQFIYEFEMTNKGKIVIYLKDGTRSELNSAVLQQYTGLKDKNGTEIYEGDILELDYEGLEKTRHKVVWQPVEHYPAFDLIPPIYYSECNCLSEMKCAGYDNYEVIGNIYENPELLEKDND